MDHDPDNALVYRSLPGNSGVLERSIAVGSQVAIVTDGRILQSVYPDEYNADPTGSGQTPGWTAATGIINKANGITVRLVALGLGLMKYRHEAQASGFAGRQADTLACVSCLYPRTSPASSTGRNASFAG